MKKTIILLVLSLVAMYSCNPKGYVINGYVGDSTLVDHNVYLRDAFSDKNLDTSLVKSDGTFVFKGEVGEAEDAFLALVSIEYSEANSVLVVENGRINVNFEYVDGNFIPSVGGTSMNETICALDKDIKQYKDTLVNRLDLLEADMMLSDQEKEAKSYSFIEEFKNAYSQRCSTVFNDNKDNAVGLFSILNWSAIDESLDVDSLASIAGEVISKNPIVQQMAATQKRAKATQPGNQYIDLMGVDASGNSVSLSDYVGKGKLVLVDFWASWCVPCKGEIPYLADINKKYGKTVTVVGLNVWDNLDEFNKARADLKINWPQIVDPTGQTFAENYGVSAIPQIILIGKDGTILARDLRGEEIAKTIEKFL